VPGWSPLAALAIATLALAALSVHAVSRESRTRRQLVAETYVGVAGLAAARIADELAATNTVIAAALRNQPDARGVFDALEGIERDHPWLGPLVVVPLRAAAQPDSGSSASFDALYLAAERAELVERRPPEAAELYRQAAAVATSSPIDHLRAMNGAGRAALNSGQPATARRTYLELIAKADGFDPEQARWIMVAWSQVLECDRRLDDRQAEVVHALQHYRETIGYQFVLEPDTLALYLRSSQAAIERVAGRLDLAQEAHLKGLRFRAAETDAIAPAIRGRPGAPAGPVSMAVGVVDGPRASVAFGAQAVFRRAVENGGAGLNAGVAVVDASSRTLWGSVQPVPTDAARAAAALDATDGWRVVAYPRSGSIDTLATREVTQYALWLLLVCGTVVVALALAARSVRRELLLSRMRSEFVSSVSHELKTPLSLIRMFGESLREGWVPDARKGEYYEVITRESERLTGLIDNVLDFSKIEAGTRRYRFLPTDLRQVTNDLLDRYDFHLRAAGVDCVRILPNAPTWALVDRDAIEQALLNLLSNAVKYMGDPDRQPRRVTVTLEHAGTGIVLRVSDTGIGMTDEHRHHIFERFYRADDDRVRNVAGSGLGLTLVQVHVHAHGGTIEVESAPGRGSTFTIALPAGVQGAPL
jgi:signal transduction histidine kinase